MKGNAMFYHLPKRKKSIQYQLLMDFLLIAVVPAVIISVSTYVVSLHLIRDKVTNSFSQTIGYIKDDVERRLVQIEQVTGYIFANSDVRRAVSTQGKSAYERTKDCERLYEIFDNFSISSSFRSIKTIRLYNEEGLVFSYSLDPTYSAFDDEKIMKSPYFDEALHNRGETVWVNLEESYEFNPAGTNDSISLFRVIKNENYIKPAGVMYVCVKQDYFSPSVRGLASSETGEIYIADSRGDVLNGVGISNIGAMPDAKDGVVITDTISSPRWTIVGKLNGGELAKDTPVLFLVAAAAMLVSFGFSCVIWYLISRSILRPIKKLTSSCQRIVSGGDLSTKVPVESEDEVGILSRNFNYMIDRVNRLLEESIRKQNRIRDAEYKALQAQITPHFLYNTLSSIKWMATIQNVPNIAKAAETLGRLLKNTTSKTKMMITVRREIENVLDYVFLQKLAYSDKFELFFCVDPKVLDLYCLKFILQPIVENAVFHGIQPKQGVGCILVEIFQKDDRLFFVVSDDGVGIPAEKLPEILEPYDPAEKGLSGRIGINNVNRRIKNVYGDAFGLSIFSRDGEFTRVTAEIPVRLQGEDET